MIVHIYKRKGDRACCDNHRGISLLSIAGKVLARVLLNRLNDHVHSNCIIPESQCGFRAERGTMDMIFTVRQVQEECREQHQNLYMVFIDLTKAFDSVNRQGLWQVLRKIGCPEKFVNPFTKACKAGSSMEVTCLIHSLCVMEPSKVASWMHYYLASFSRCYLSPLMTATWEFQCNSA